MKRKMAKAAARWRDKQTHRVRGNLRDRVVQSVITGQELWLTKDEARHVLDHAEQHGVDPGNALHEKMVRAASEQLGKDSEPVRDAVLKAARVASSVGVPLSECPNQDIHEDIARDGEWCGICGCDMREWLGLPVTDAAEVCSDHE